MTFSQHNFYKVNPIIYLTYFSYNYYEVERVSFSILCLSTFIKSKKSFVFRSLPLDFYKVEQDLLSGQCLSTFIKSKEFCFLRVCPFQAFAGRPFTGAVIKYDWDRGGSKAQKVKKILAPPQTKAFKFYAPTKVNLSYPNMPTNVSFKLCLFGPFYKCFDKCTHG